MLRLSPAIGGALLLGLCVAASGCSPSNTSSGATDSSFDTNSIATTLVATNPNPVQSNTAGAGSTIPAAATMSQWIERVTGCLQNAGWDVTPDLAQDGYEIGVVPESQKGAFEQSQKDCRAEAGPAPNSGPLTAEYVSALYDHMVKMKACLADHGYATSDPPSKSVYIDDYLSGRAPWHPFAEVPASIPQEEWSALNEDCPQDLN